MAEKGILWSIVFLITTIIYFTIPTYLIFTYWIWLNEIVDPEGQPVYTYALLALFLYFVTLLVGLIYSVATVRAVVQRKNEEGLGIPKGVKGFGLVSTIFVVSLMIIWYYLFNEIAIFTWKVP
ncbi:MAG: hypothetical protein EU532_11365 [Promethearchaeota archaeon]|nr:MAG: hypothetical protein EU532_11365 [Candidatus Lokiarchaeota archaeon]